MSGAGKSDGARTPGTDEATSMPPPLGPGAEFDRIRRFLAAGTAERPDVRIGPGDDCAVVAGDGIALSADLSIEGVHFRRDWLDPREIGYRAAAGALSDLAAMAARPIGVLVSLAVPASGAGQGGGDAATDDAASDDAPTQDAASDGAAGDDAVIDDAMIDDAAIVDGAREAAGDVGATLLGGDLSVSPGPITLDVVVVGETASPVRRSGARAGDSLWVSGELGAAAAAVLAWRRGGSPSASARNAFATPRPRTAEARWLAERATLHAMIDLSDGLAGDAAHLAAASAVAIVIEPDRVPIHPAAREVADGSEAALRLALGGGEDYQLLFAAPEGAVEPLVDAFESTFGLGLRRVGEVREGAGVHVVARDGTLEPPPVRGYRHFEEDAS